MKRILTSTALICALFATVAFGRDFWEFPNVTDLPDEAEFLIYDPNIPAPDTANRRTRNITGAALKNVFRNRSSVTLPHFNNYSAARADEIAQINEILDGLTYVAPGSPSVSGGGSYEIGQAISSVALVWSITLGSKPLTSQSLNNGIGALDVADRSYTHGGQNITSNRTYTVSISDGTTNRSGSTTVAFYYKRFWGVSASETLDDSAIRALSQEYASNRAQSRSMTAAGQYLWFCWPDDWGTPTWTVNGLPNTDFVLVRNDTFTNASGYSYTIRLYRSGNLLTGTYNVVVS